MIVYRLTNSFLFFLICPTWNDSGGHMGPLDAPHPFHTTACIHNPFFFSNQGSLEYYWTLNSDTKEGVNVHVLITQGSSLWLTWTMKTGFDRLGGKAAQGRYWSLGAQSSRAYCATLMFDLKEAALWPAGQREHACGDGGGGSNRIVRGSMVLKGRGSEDSSTPRQRSSSRQSRRPGFLWTSGTNHKNLR